MCTKTAAMCAKNAATMCAKDAAIWSKDAAMYAKDPTLCAEDNSAYFRQFQMCRRDYGLLGFPWKHREGPVMFYDTTSMVFGGSPFPNRAQRISALDTAVVAHRMRPWEERVRGLAEDYEAGIDTSPLARAAAMIAPKALRGLVAERARDLGEEQADPHYTDKCK